MNNDIKIFIKNNIFITYKIGSSITIEEIKNTLNCYENTVNKKYNLVLYKDSLGYYFGYDIKDNKDIYCGGTMNESKAIQKIKEYGKNKN